MRLVAIAFFVLTLVPATAFAYQECTSDIDCDEGWECLPLPCGCACPDCPPGEDCPPCECDDCGDLGECIPAGFGKECDSDEDCPEGFECWDAPGPTCACPGCEPGEDCPPCDCPEDDGDYPGMCVEEEDPFDDIVGNECDTDEDCPADFVCEEIEYGCGTVPDCPPCVCGGGCDPDDEDCADEPECECPVCPEPEPCDEELVGMCVFSPPECEVDADCGEGYECVEIEECWGSVSGGDCVCTDCVCAECPDGEDCPPCDCPEEPICECDEEEEWEEGCETVMAICLPQQIECETDDDCPVDFVCNEFTDYGDCECVCACPPCPEGEECPACECDDCECDEETTESFCLPEGWDESMFGGDGGGSTAIGEDDPNPQDPVNREEDKEGEEGTGDDVDLDGEGPEDGPDGDGPADENDDDGEGEGEGGAGEVGSDDGGSAGCSAGGAPAAGFPLLLVAFAVLALLPARRRRNTL